MLDVMVITYNEAMNLPHCLKALQGWVNRIFVIDSGSTDGTPDLARQAGAEVIHHAWEGYARQKNWALANLPFESPWILILDADEIITPSVRDRILQITSRPAAEIAENGFFINRLTFFLGKPIRHGGYYPSWNMRLIKRGAGLYEDRAVHEHIIIPDPVGYIRQPMHHDDRRGLEHYLAKHNRYSTLEARSLWQEMQSPAMSEKANLSPDARHRRWLKRVGMRYIPWPGGWRFLYMYFFRLGILDGTTGLEFCRLISMYDAMVAMKLRAIRRHGLLIDSPSVGKPGEASARPTLVSYAKPGLAQTEGTVLLPSESTGITEQMQPESSPWTFKEKLARVAWMLVGRPMFRFSFHNWYGYRAWLLRRFGARIGRSVAIRPSVNIEIPWMLRIDEQAVIGDHAILYCLGPVHIGPRTIISQYAHLCAGTHDYSDRTFRLIRSPITVGSDVWIGADAFVGPRVTIGRLSVIGARSSVYKDMPEKMICAGNPAKPIRQRILK